ncbi:hypothetical protein K440DRAFT_642108 [Wilcoxina mikolae CBS 423.85]|nr:hypothetical protein K440DRAFT_642108 [Wilcoxina mikolae CBS 423.85]
MYSVRLTNLPVRELKKAGSHNSCPIRKSFVRFANCRKVHELAIQLAIEPAIPSHYPPLSSTEPVPKTETPATTSDPPDSILAASAATLEGSESAPYSMMTSQTADDNGVTLQNKGSTPKLPPPPPLLRSQLRIVAQPPHKGNRELELNRLCPLNGLIV